MLDTRFRNFFAKSSLPLTMTIARTGVSPNTLTVLAFLISASAGMAIYFERPFLALLLWWSGRLLDAMDGELARHLGKASAFGAFLDITLDMLAYSSIILGFAFAYPEFQGYWITIMFLYVGCITSALALGSLLNEAHVPNSDNRGLRLATGMAEGGETGIAYTFFLLLPGSMSYLLPLWIFILSVTIGSRIILAYQVSGK